MAAQSSSTTQQKWLMFSKGAIKVFDNWTVLHLAVENGWGGRESNNKKRALVDLVLSLFRDGGSRVKVDKLSDLLFDRLLNSFCVETDDDSPFEVAQLLVDMYSNCLKGDFSLCQQIEFQTVAKVNECEVQDNVIAGLAEDFSDQDETTATTDANNMDVDGG
eukprot:GHVS01073906.1.p1 GENE.GHVS01073906.1~~GHVS01073906.1.p1  ORF type:complete len:162 (+),score=30.45 GHVS01073906.1:328-813(+)